MNIEIGLLIAVIGCFIALAGWLSGRDKKISTDSEWKGMINAKLDMIVGIKADVSNIEKDVNEHSVKIRAVEESTKQAHKRLDEHIANSK